MKEKPVNIHKVVTSLFTMRIFARRSKFLKRCAHIAEVIPNNNQVWESFILNNVKISPWSLRSSCSWKQKLMYIKFNGPSRFLLSRAVAEELIPTLGKREIPPITPYVIFDYGGISGDINTNCKESVIEHIISARKLKFSNNLPLTEKQQNLILKWTEKLGGIKFIDNIIIEISDWWLTCERAGWLLLALRVATGEYVVPCKKMEDAFRKFIDTGAVDIPEGAKWASNWNWQYHFENEALPYFEGGMEEPALPVS